MIHLETVLIFLSLNLIISQTSFWFGYADTWATNSPSFFKSYKKEILRKTPQQQNITIKML